MATLPPLCHSVSRSRYAALAATDPGSEHAIQPTDPGAIRMLNDPNATPAQTLDAIFPTTATDRTAQQAYVERLLTWPGVQLSDFDASPATIREQSVAEGPQQWSCPGCGAYGRLPTIQAPTLVAAGTDDIIEPPDNARLLTQRIPHAQITLFPDGGHAFIFQDHVAVAARVNRFLR